jgi:outer membrane protein insertion porin family
MSKHALTGMAFSALLAAAVPVVISAQAAAASQEPAQAPAPPPPGTLAVSACGNPLPPPPTVPAAGSGPVLWIVDACFPKQDNVPFVEVESYQFYARLLSDSFPGSVPSEGKWVPYTVEIERTAREDFKALMNTGFLDDLKIQVTDAVFANGVIGKIISFEMEERERVKVVTYEGSKEIDRTKLEEVLTERKLTIAPDSMLDERKIQQVKAVVRDMMTEKGFSAAEVTHSVEKIPGSAKTVNLTFNISEGRKVKIRRVEFVGNSAISDRRLRRQLKENKPTGWLSWITGTGTYNAPRYEEDAERVREYYHNRGYANATVGQPELRVLEDTKDGKTQWIEVRIPVTEGAQYTFGELEFEGQERFNDDFLKAAYDVEPGEIYSRKKLVEGFRKAQEFYGAFGFMEFTALPELHRSDSPTNPEAALAALVPEALTVPANGNGEKPHVDVTVRVTEGEQFVVNRIVFTGNTTTRDNVIRRELGRLVEGAPFDSNALKDSVRRLNQLGYFKPLEGNERDVQVDKTAGATNLVDVTMRLEEQNRNQLTFGAGISQYEGFFGQLAFQTSNFLGRGESLTVSLQGGERAQNYQLGFTEPFLFDRNITGGISLHKRELQYIGYYTQKSTGGSLTFGFPLRAWTRMFVNYSYEEVGISDLNEAIIDSSCLFSQQGCASISSLNDLSDLTPTQLERINRNPFLSDSLLIGQGGKRTISKVVPTILHNTVNHPIFPTRGKKYTGSVDVAAFGGNTNFYKPHLEGIWYLPHLSRTQLGLRAQFEYIAPLGDTVNLPVFERLFLGGEYSIRGYDIRSIGPTVENSQVVLGGNKSLLFNAEYSVTIAEPVRLLFFYDAGQVRNFGEEFSWKEDLTRIVVPPAPPLLGQFGNIVQDPNAPTVTTEVIGKTSAFKTSTGVELRFFMPVLNVPFRLIYAWNPQRGGVLDNDLRPAKSSVFKFSVGTTF